MLKKYSNAYLLGFFRLAIAYLIGLLSMASVNAHQDLTTPFPLDRYDQKVESWLKPGDSHYDTPVLSSRVQQKHMDNFYEHFFGVQSPWNPQYVNQIFRLTAPHDVKSVQQAALEKFQNIHKPAHEIGHGENFYPHPPSWITRISHHMNLPQFDRLHYDPKNRAITIDNLHARLLPTEDAHFYSHKLPGQGYPFDNLQMSSIWVGTPVYILGKSKDRNWLLVLTPDYTVWVKASGVAHVSGSFVTQWQSQAKKHLVSIIRTQTPVKDEEGHFLYSTYVGTIFPGEENGRILVPIPDHQGKATIRHAEVNKNNVARMPLTSTPRHFSKVISTLIGRPYGWGNRYFYNDCSAEMKSLFTPFGVWLPRQSSDQAKMGKVVNLNSLTKEERLAYLLEKGRPLVTLVYIGGHIVLYVGKYPHLDKKGGSMAMTYQNLWGLSPKPPIKRAVVGRAAFLPMLLQYPEDIHLVSMADKRIFQMVYLD